MNPRIIFHIGQQKSGTTSLQHTFIADRDRLRSKGILYPAAGHRRARQADRFQPSHNGIFHLLEGQRNRKLPKSIDVVAEQLHREIRDAQPEVVIISAEHAFMAADQDLDVLAGFDELLPGPKDVVAYLRRPDQYITSFHKHDIRMSNRLPGLHTPERLDQLMQTCQLDQRRGIGRFIDRYGAVELVDYARAGNTVDHFYRAVLEIEPPAGINHRSNPSIPSVMADLARQHVIANGDLSPREVGALIHHGEREAVDLLGEANRSRLLEYYRPHNAYLGALVGRDVFFADLDEMGTPPSGSLTVAEANERYHDVFQALMTPPDVHLLRRDCIEFEHRGWHHAASRLFELQRPHLTDEEITWFTSDLEAATEGAWTITDGRYKMTGPATRTLPQQMTSAVRRSAAARRVVRQLRRARRTIASAGR